HTTPPITPQPPINRLQVKTSLVIFHMEHTLYFSLTHSLIFNSIWVSLLSSLSLPASVLICSILCIYLSFLLHFSHSLFSITSLTFFLPASLSLSLSLCVCVCV